MARREINVFNIAFLDLISGALGAVIILYVAVPKHESKDMVDEKKYQEVIEQKEELQKQLSTTDEKIKELEEKIKSSEEEKQKMASEHEEKMEEAKKAIEKVEKIQEEEREKITSKEDEETEKTSEGIKAVGFDFKGKKLVFIIDVSGSMESNNLIGEVKAGLKMLVTSLTKEYEVDVIFFPDGLHNRYRALWGRIKPVTKENKDAIYTFLRGLIPFGATPTRSVLNYALDQYPDATDIILLSDGAPSKPNSTSTDSVDDIVEQITRKNKRQNNVQINTLGVGPDFRFGKRESSKLYRFLHQLAKDNDGFFHGF